MFGGFCLFVYCLSMVWNGMDYGVVYGLSAKSRRNSGQALWKPQTENQCQYMDYLLDPQRSLVVATGPAGSGKTLLACACAMDALQKGHIRKIVLTRPLVGVEEEEIGFLPGNLVHKMDPWTKPMFDIFLEMITMGELQQWVKEGIIEVAPLGFMRGRSFHYTFVLADEMQNSSPGQMKMLATRIGKGSKLVMTGDLAQSDWGEKTNGLADFLNRFDQHVSDAGPVLDIGWIDMDHSDIQRSALVQHILDIYDTAHLGSPKAPTIPGALDSGSSSSHTIPLRDCGRPYPK